MNHAEFQGSHYEIGFQWGALLAEHGNFILHHVPFAVTKERIDFAAACVPIYQEYFPEILEEIQGLAHGQKEDVRLFQAVLFSMYAMVPGCRCSCFAVSNGEQIFLGRNSDFLTELEEQYLNVIYHTADSFLGNSFTGNTTAFIEMEDGINEHGLSVGLTSVYPHHIQPGINAGMLVRLFLEKCRTVRQAIELLERIPVSSAQTLTVADAAGEICVMECNADGLEIITPSKDLPFVCATNVFHSKAMAPYVFAGIDNWEAEPRYQTLDSFLRKKAGQMEISDAMELLKGNHGFLCQYDRATGKDTVWSVVYDIKGKKIYRAEGNPGRTEFLEDRRFFPK